MIFGALTPTPDKYTCLGVFEGAFTWASLGRFFFGFIYLPAVDENAALSSTTLNINLAVFKRRFFFSQKGGFLAL